MKVVHTHYNLEKIKKHREGKELCLESHPLEAVAAHVACPLCPPCCGRMFGPNVMSRHRACISVKQQHFMPWGRRGQQGCGSPVVFTGTAPPGGAHWSYHGLVACGHDEGPVLIWSLPSPHRSSMGRTPRSPGTTGESSTPSTSRG